MIAKSGTIYFTDPPYGLKGGKPEMAIHGVYAVHPAAPNKVSLIVSDIQWPNGIALSPDQKTLYVAVSDKENTRIMAYVLNQIATVVDGVPILKPQKGRVFFEAQSLKTAERKGGCDGLKVDTQGNIWSTGPGGVLIIDKNGRHLGTILTGQATANCAFGGEDRGTVYITADMFLLRVKTLTKGL